MSVIGTINNGLCNGYGMCEFMPKIPIEMELNNKKAYAA